MSTIEAPTLPDAPEGATPEVIDGVAFAKLYGEPLFKLPQDLYIPPDALEIFLEAFEGPLDLLLYLIRKQNFNVLDIPMAEVTRQYLAYVEQIRKTNLELAAEYLFMAALLIEIKSRMLLPRPKLAEGDESEDPRAELIRRLQEYERFKKAAEDIEAMPQEGPRVDAELVFPGGWAVAWREWAAWRAGQVGALLVRRIDGVNLVEDWPCHSLQSA